MNTDEKLVAAAKRAARKAAKTSAASYQTCLDDVARKAGRRNWSDFLGAPVPIDEASAKAASEPDFTVLPPERHLEAVVGYGRTVEARRFTATGRLGGAVDVLAYGSLDDGGHEHGIDARGLDIRALIYSAVDPSDTSVRCDVGLDPTDPDIRTINAALDGSAPNPIPRSDEDMARLAQLAAPYPREELERLTAILPQSPQHAAVGRTTVLRRSRTALPPTPGKGLPPRDERPRSDGMLLGTSSLLSRKIRSSPDATVLVAGQHGSGKTVGIVLPAILDAPHLNVVIRDSKGETIPLLGDAWHSHPNRLILDPLTRTKPDGPDADNIGAFNVLHPEMRYADVTTIASDVGDILIPRRQGQADYFQDAARHLLVAAIVAIDQNPELVPLRDGSQRVHPSLPAVHDLFDGIVASRFAKLADVVGILQKTGPDSAFAAFSSLVGMGENERSGVIGTLDQALYPMRNADVRAMLDPVEGDKGAMLARALSDRNSPALVVIACRPIDWDVFTGIQAIMVETAARLGSCWSGTSRPMHLHVDDAARMAAAPWIHDAIRGQQWPGVTTSLGASTREQVDLTVAATYAGARGLTEIVIMPGAGFDFATSLERRFGPTATEIVAIQPGRHMLLSPQGVQMLKTSRHGPAKARRRA